MMMITQNAKKVIKLETMKEVVDLCIKKPNLQERCPSACQAWCNKKMKFEE